MIIISQLSGEIKYGGQLFVAEDFIDKRYTCDYEKRKQRCLKKGKTFLEVS